MTTGNSAALIGLDWGTTSLRAHLLDSAGAVLDRRSTAEGILAEHKDGFTGTFLRILGDWLDGYPGLPIIASGMITSRNGWMETPYVRTPGGIEELASSLVPFDVTPTCRLHFVCGMDRDPAGEAPDIMRGEETQIVGCMADRSRRNGLFVMPGTHSKWVSVRDARLDRFDTYMTGEVFAVLKAHSILGRLMEEHGGSLTGGFEKGVKARLDSGASLLRHIFSTRTLALYDRLSLDEGSDYLSGLLIGEEIRSVMGDYRLDDRAMAPVTIVGSGVLTERYGLALELAGIEAMPAPDDAAANGQYAIARAAGLITV